MCICTYVIDVICIFIFSKMNIYEMCAIFLHKWFLQYHNNANIIPILETFSTFTIQEKAVKNVLDM